MNGNNTTSRIEFTREELEGLFALLTMQSISAKTRRSLREKMEPMIQHTPKESSYTLLMDATKIGTKKQATR